MIRSSENNLAFTLLRCAAVLALIALSATTAFAAGDGTFGPKTDFGAGVAPFSVALADVNGDGALDAVTANATSANISVLLGNGDGTFQAKTDFAAGGGPVSVALADVNGDGALDAVTANNHSDNISVLLAIITNQPPVADAGDDDDVEWASGGTQVQLDGTGSSDPDEDELTYAWTAPPGVVLDDATSATPMATFAALGDFEIELVVNDGQFDSSANAVTVTVEDTTAPLVGLVNTFVAVVPTTPTGTMVDVLAASGVTVSDACDPNPDLTHDAPAEFPIGLTTNVTFTATDASGNVDSQVFAVTVLTASEATQDLIQNLLSLGLQTGVENSLKSKLSAVVNVLNDGNEMNDGAAVNTLMAFIAATEAQRGKKLTDAQANQLIAAAQTIIAALGG